VIDFILLDKRRIKIAEDVQVAGTKEEEHIIVTKM
jgi:hypothetical protein